MSMIFSYICLIIYFLMYRSMNIVFRCVFRFFYDLYLPFVSRFSTHRTSFYSWALFKCILFYRCLYINIRTINAYTIPNIYIYIYLLAMLIRGPGESLFPAHIHTHTHIYTRAHSHQKRNTQINTHSRLSSLAPHVDSCRCQSSATSYLALSAMSLAVRNNWSIWTHRRRRVKFVGTKLIDRQYHCE